MERIRGIAQIEEIGEHLKEKPPTREMTPEERQAIRAKIIGAARDEYTNRSARFVVEGAKVVCTSMEEPESQSRMKRLDDETRRSRIPVVSKRLRNRAISRETSMRRLMNAQRLMGTSPFRFSGRKETPDWTDRTRVIGDEENEVTFWSRFTMNSGQLLNHLDIEFEPLFGMPPIDDSENDSEDVEAVVGYYQKMMRKNKLAEKKALSKIPADSKCKYSACGKCKPDGFIEHHMWQDARPGSGVDMAGVDTLLTNSAYMFCHYGQGMLYIQEDGQHPFNVEAVREKARVEVEEDIVDENEIAYYREKAMNDDFTPNFVLESNNYENPRLTTFSGGPMTNPRRIILHQTAGWPWGTAASIHADHLNVFEGGRGIAYHFVVETGLNQHGDQIVGDARVVQGRPLNIQGWHTGGLDHPASQDAIGIAVPGNFTEEELLYGVIPQTDINKNQIADRLVEIIAECLVLFPQIPRINLAENPRYHPRRQPMEGVDSEGIFGHADVDPSNCPGPIMGDGDIINRAIELANQRDGGR
ncbi:MAG: peptidoglycan recognition protein family protein [Defluviitaleaceae bacterium]|nr:peptidoglycan recognition protein family protein [Defluviitaleaceae bacterium]